jgi:hypothetical protein
MKEHVEMWKARIFRTKSVNEDFPKLKSAIDGIYEAANLNKPIVVLVPSPVVMAYAYGAAAVIWDKRAKGQVVEVPSYEGPRNAVWDAVLLATQTRSEPVSASVLAPADLPADPIKAARDACLAIAGEEGIAAAKTWNSVMQSGAYAAFDDAYFTAFRDILNLKLPIFEKYKHWEQAAIYGTFRVMHEKFCIVSDFPEVLTMDEQNRAHGQTGPSHRFRDGWEISHWHGTCVPNEWFKVPGALNAKVALTWQNIEQRRAACEILGWAKVLADLDTKVINEDADPEIGRLVEVVLPDIGTEKFLVAQCGTGRTFAIPVPPTMKTAMEANAWTYSLNLDDFTVPEVRT